MGSLVSFVETLDNAFIFTLMLQNLMINKRCGFVSETSSSRTVLLTYITHTNIKEVRQI